MSENNESLILPQYSNVIEAGECMVQKEFKVSLRDICGNNNIKEGDIIVVYIKKTNKKKTNKK